MLLREVGKKRKRPQGVRAAGNQKVTCQPGKLGKGRQIWRHRTPSHGWTHSQRDKRHTRYERLLKTRDRERCHPGKQARSREELRQEPK